MLPTDLPPQLSRGSHPSTKENLNNLKNGQGKRPSTKDTQQIGGNLSLSNNGIRLP